LEYDTTPHVKHVGVLSDFGVDEFEVSYIRLVSNHIHIVTKQIRVCTKTDEVYRFVQQLIICEAFSSQVAACNFELNIVKVCGVKVSL